MARKGGSQIFSPVPRNFCKVDGMYEELTQLSMQNVDISLIVPAFSTPNQFMVDFACGEA